MIQLFKSESMIGDVNLFLFKDEDENERFNFNVNIF